MRSCCSPLSGLNSVAQVDLSPAAASCRFSYTVCSLEHRRLLKLAADAGARDLRLVEPQQVERLAEPGGAVSPGASCR